MKPFIEAVMELRKMPDAPKNSADDEAMLEALNRWTGFPRGEIKRGFMAGWRAAMAEVKRERDYLDPIVRDERAEDVRWDRRNV